jgi:tetratricopeptide (TPR) repeat protein
LRTARPLLLALALAALAHLPALRAGFVQDDHVIVETSAVVARGSLPEIVASSWWAGSPLDDRALWRPVTIASFALERALTGAPSAALAHALNLAWHLAACALLYALARRLGADAFGAGAAAALFGVLPVRAEAVFSVVGRADVLAGVFTLAAALAFRKRASRAAPWLAGLAVAAAAGSKETGLAAVAVLAALDAIEGRPRRPWRAWAPVLLLAGAAVALRTWGLEGFFPAPNLPAIDNPIAALAGSSRVGTALAVVTRYAALIVAPVALAHDYSGPSVPVEAGILTMRALAGAALLLGAAALALAPWISRSRAPALRVAAAGAALALLPYLVVSNLFRPIGVAMAERLTYIPAAGIALAAGAGLAALGRRKVATAIVVVVVLAGAARTFVRAFDWKDDRTIFAAATRANPASPRGWYAVARLDADALADPRSEPAAVARILSGLDRALALWDDYPVAWHAKGRLLARRGDFEAAEPLLRAAVRRGPALADAWVDLGLVLQRRDRALEAQRAFRKAVLFDPSQDKAWASLGHLAFEAARFPQAAGFYERAVGLGRRDLEPRLAEARRRAGTL